MCQDGLGYYTKLVMLKCKSCGANLNVEAGQRHVTCRYCGTEFLLEDEPSLAQEQRGKSSFAQTAPVMASGWLSTKVVLILGGILFAVTFIAAATRLGLRVLGFSVQEWCVFAYAAILVKYYRSCGNANGRRLAVAYWIFACVVLVLQIVVWINNGSFTLLQLP